MGGVATGSYIDREDIEEGGWKRSWLVNYLQSRGEVVTYHKGITGYRDQQTEEKKQRRINISSDWQQTTLRIPNPYIIIIILINHRIYLHAIVPGILIRWWYGMEKTNQINDDNDNDILKEMRRSCISISISIKGDWHLYLH